jgi:hypothetical protein
MQSGIDLMNDFKNEFGGVRNDIIVNHSLIAQ